MWTIWLTPLSLQVIRQGRDDHAGLEEERRLDNQRPLVVEEVLCRHRAGMTLGRITSGTPPWRRATERLAAGPAPPSAPQHNSILGSLQGPSTLDDTNQDHHDRDDHENVNESPQCVRGDQP